MLVQAALGVLLLVTYLGEPTRGMSLASLKKDGQLLDGKKTTCYNTSDPAAVNATVVYDFEDDDGNLWKSDPGSPLPLCSSSFSSNSTRCNVCRGRMVFIMCCDLAEGVKVMMEKSRASIEIEQIDCLKLLSDDGDSGQLGTAASHIGVIIGVVIVAAVVAVVLVNVGNDEVK